MICAKLGSVFAMLVVFSQDLEPAHRETTLWATNLVAKYTGPSGYRRIVTFSVDADHATVTWKLTLLQQKKNGDISVAADDLKGMLATSFAIFGECRLFSATRQDTYTWPTMNSLK